MAIWLPTLEIYEQISMFHLRDNQFGVPMRRRQDVGTPAETLHRGADENGVAKFLVLAEQIKLLMQVCQDEWTEVLISIPLVDKKMEIQIAHRDPNRAPQPHRLGKYDYFRLQQVV